MSQATDPTTTHRPRVEWPTLAVSACIYTGFALLTWFHHQLPWPLILLLGGYIVAWHGSLQHEVAHGHPTRNAWLNEALVFPSLWLWLPFRLYRSSHLVHHRDDHLTDPSEDPESWYLPARRWTSMSPGRRWLRTLLDTAAGRLLLAPMLLPVQLVARTLHELRDGRLEYRAWLLHGLGAAVVLAWALGVCGIALHEYLLLYVYPGLAVTLLRSFAEHEAHPDVAQRTCAVEAHPALSLLYLNNNLHPAHHRSPGLPWYQLPDAWQALRTDFTNAHPDGVFRGYGSVLLRFAVTRRLSNPWPLECNPGLRRPIASKHR